MSAVFEEEFLSDFLKIYCYLFRWFMCLIEAIYQNKLLHLYIVKVKYIHGQEASVCIMLKQDIYKWVVIF